MKEVILSSLDKTFQNLLDEASRIKETAYNPYSNFYVGASLLAFNNEIISASNFENASYGGTICAERSAILKANSMNVRKIKAIAIIGRGKDFDSQEVISPCGLCRQVIYEVSQISDYNIQLILSNTKMTKIILTDINELLPLAFGPKDLGIDLSKYHQI